MSHLDAINRQVYGRLYSGAFQTITKTTQADLIGAVFDSTYMPAVVIDPGKQCFHSFTMAQNTSYSILLPPDYDVTRPMYVAVQSDLKARVNFDSPTYGNGNIALLYGTNSSTDGVHYGVWTFQGDLTAFSISIPSTADGGATTRVKVFMYEIPDLTTADSFFDRQIGLGTTDGGQ